MLISLYQSGLLNRYSGLEDGPILSKLEIFKGTICWFVEHYRLEEEESTYICVEMKWKTRRIPANIELISRLLNCALSPISHEDFQFLRCLQYGLLTSEDTALSQADAKGLSSSGVFSITTG